MKDPGVFTIHTDGAARANPGPAAYSYVIERPGQPDVEVKQRLGETTNNIAEYTALVKALEHAKNLHGRRLEIFSDSELMVNQMNGQYKVKHPGLLPLYTRAKELCADFDTVVIRHVRREHNSRADRLCNEALDGESSPALASMPEAAEKPAPRAKKPRAESPGGLEKVRKKAVAYLWSQAALWAEGNADNPDPEEVWDHLWQILEEGGVVAPSSPPES